MTEAQRVRPVNPQRIVLAGFMGSGKSTVGRELARQLGWGFADLDDAVSKREGLSVPAIFAQQGEPYFRAEEVAALRNLLQQAQLVIALGGGAPETPALRALLLAEASTVVVHLHAPLEMLFSRCVAQADDPGATERPLLGTLEAMTDRYSRRLPFYAALAHHVVDVSALDPVEIAAELRRQCWG